MNGENTCLNVGTLVLGVSWDTLHLLPQSFLHHLYCSGNRLLVQNNPEAEEAVRNLIQLVLI